MYVIKRLSDDKFLGYFSLSRSSFSSYWAIKDISAMHFSCVEEVKAIIDFLINVIDEEFDGDLIYVRVPV